MTYKMIPTTFYYTEHKYNKASIYFSEIWIRNISYCDSHS